jgi:hypothetical protein
MSLLTNLPLDVPDVQVERDGRVEQVARGAPRGQLAPV